VAWRRRAISTSEGVEQENRSKIEGNRRVATRDRTNKVMDLLGALR